jgi:RecA/RadA recombinase
MTPTAVSLEGQTNTFSRIATGLWSLDRLFMDKAGHVGIPMRTTLELYGYPGAGKSTLATALSGSLCKAVGAKKIVVADLETAYEEDHTINTLIHAGFEGTVKMIESIDSKGRGRSHEEILDETVSSLQDAEVGSVIIDSLGMIMSTGERESSMGSANWGQRAKLIAQMQRKILYQLRVAETPQVVWQINHQYEAMGGRGHITPGGNAKTYAVAGRLSLYKKEQFDSGASLVQIKPEKMRLGGLRPKARAYVVILPGFGVSWDLTAVFDCFELGVASRSTTVKVLNQEGKTVSAGRLNALIEKAYAEDHEAFVDFHWQLAHVDTNVTLEGEDEDTTSGREE